MGVCFSCKKRLLDKTSRVIEIENQRHYKKQIASAADGNYLTVVQFTAVWCGPCRAISSILDSMSLDYPKVKFIRIDIDNECLWSIVQKSQIKAVPTFEFIKNKRVIDRFIGSNKNKLESCVEQLII